MENNLDKYFKDNLHDQKFEIKEEYWLGAEKLIEANERRRKRRGLFWWFGGGLAVLALVALGWWLLGKNGGEQRAENPVEIAAQTRFSGSEASPVSDEKSGTKPTGQSSENGQDEGAATPFPEGHNNQSEAVATLKPLISQTLHLSNPPSLKPSISQPLNLSNPQTLAQQQQSPILPQAPPETEHFERQHAPDFLALLPAFVTSNFEPKNLAANVKIEVAKQRKWHLGLVASQMLNARPSNGEQTRIGLRAGLVVRYDLPGNWYLSSGFQYQRRSGSFEATKLAAQRNYRFGLEMDTLLLRPNNLHYLSLPVLLGWERSRHQFEAGLLLDFLTGVHGESGSYQKTGEPPVKRFEQDKSGWISTDGYRRFTPTAQLGYRYRAFGKWSLGLTANFTFGGILDKDFESPLGGFLLKESDNFYLGFQAVYFIK